MGGLEGTVQQFFADGMAAFQKTVAMNFGAKSTEDAQKNQEAVEAATTRLEERIDRYKEEQSAQMLLMKRDQERFQEEMKTLMAALKKPETQFEDVEGDSNHRRNFERGGHWKYRKLDMSLLEGKDPDGWILRGEKHFDIYKLTEGEKLDVAVVSMEGDALRWYTFESRRHPTRTWLELKAKVLAKFRPTSAGTLHEQSLATTQTTTVAEYQRMFIELASPLNDVPESIMMGQFINELKEDIKSEIQLLNPFTLDDAMDLEVRVKERNRVQGLRRSGLGPVRNGDLSYFSKSPIAAANNHNVSTTQPQSYTSNNLTQ